MWRRSRLNGRAVRSPCSSTAGRIESTASRTVALIVSATCSMYQSGTKPQPPMKSGAE